VAKQRRAQPRHVRQTVQPSPAAAPAARPPVTRTGYVEAVAVYEQGLAALQAHEYSRAAMLLRSVLSGYPDEKELHERVRLYLNVCGRQIKPETSAPISPEERVFAATVACNAGDYDTALTHLRAANREAPDHDDALYMLATVLALRNENAEAVACLLRAIELNPENRAMARHDADLAALREWDSVRAVLKAIPMAKRAKAGRRSSARRSR
jgi:tetratricopeptide (TPR) repeat protein